MLPPLKTQYLSLDWCLGHFIMLFTPMVLHDINFRRSMPFALAIVSFIVPAQTIIVPQYIRYASLRWTNSYKPYTTLWDSA